MNFIETFKQAFDSLRANKMRSVLTMIGIVMGVFSVIAIMAIGNAAESYIVGQFEKIGANTLSITYKDSSEAVKNEWLTLEDLDVLQRSIEEVKNVATYQQRYGEIRIGDSTRDAYLIGVSAQYKEFDVLDLNEGRFINSFDNDARSKVIVVDENFAEQYFHGQDIIGDTVTLKTSGGSRVKVKIIGVLDTGDDLLNNLANNENVPALIYMPITTLQTMYYNYEKLDLIQVTADKNVDLKYLKDKIIRLMESTHRREGIYIVQTSADIQQMFSQIFNVITSGLLVIAIITLVVGGIGIINILLVSVTERIREIGIRKALGARSKDIVMQFLTESIIMTGFSGLIGIILGIVTGSIISNVIKIPPIVDMTVIISAFSGSILLGIFFGVYPAKKAAELDPIEALRHE